MASSIYASKELKKAESKGKVKYPTLRVAKEPGVGARMSNMAKRLAEPFQSPYSKSARRSKSR